MTVIPDTRRSTIRPHGASATAGCIRTGRPRVLCGYGGCPTVWLRCLPGSLSA